MFPYRYKDFIKSKYGKESQQATDDNYDHHEYQVDPEIDTCDDYADEPDDC